MANWLSILLTSFAANAALTAILLWLTKSWISERLKNAIKHEYDQKLETHKAQLHAEAARQTERLKADLQIAAAEHQIRFTRLHERAAETIAETFGRIQKLMENLVDYTKAFTTAQDLPLEQRRQQFNYAWREFREYYWPRRIFLPKTTAEQVRDFTLQIFKIADDFAYYVEGDNVPEETTKKWPETTQKLSEEVRPLLERLEADFRKHLGVIE